MKRKTKLLLVLLCFVFILTVTLAACADPVTYKVTYDSGNSEATGTAPAVKNYKEGDTVTVVGNTFTLAGYTFDGWSDGTNTYKEGDTFTMPAHDVKLTAQWKKIHTVAEALAMCGENDGWEATERIYVGGTVKSISNPTYGQMILQDETGEIEVYGTYSADGTKRYSEMDEKPYAGDTVLLYALLKNFKGTKEIGSGWIVEFKHVENNKDLSNYTPMTVDAARTHDEGELVILEGVVAQITYANGMKPSGFYLVDATNSIYVYDSQIAPQVAIGNKVKIAATRANFILDTEATNAKKFGYTGCIQVTDCVLIENDKGDNAIDFGWVTESTVKAIMDTPVNNNITTTIFKVNALVTESVGAGFINYYIDDIDGKTGSYVYTQCNGSDLAWLKEFDGKICTVYLSAINAKSSATGCVWRFQPIQVSDENYTFDEKNAPQFAIDYYGLGQFAAKYQSDPAIELVTSVSSTLLGIDNVTLSYSSSDTNVVDIETTDSATVFHTCNPGTAVITITANYKTYSATATVSVTVEEAPEFDAVTVSEAIKANVGDEVTATGIVGPSLVNKVGFYLIDETGVIAIITDSNTMATLSLGDEVVVKGTRRNNKKESSTNIHGQTCLFDTEVLINRYGHHEYSKAAFAGNLTVEEFLNLNVAEDYSTSVYTMEVKISVVESTYYANIYVTNASGEKKITLYCSSANQYSFLKKYDGQTVTVEIAACNWNDKNYYTGCVLSVTDSEGTTTYNELNFSK
ncbi:MAG: InlB B-repeat-containing protein [Clostridiales bacterium]|nr:InlB B-repeat-containing protein [Clostridiales bacterium]